MNEILQYLKGGVSGIERHSLEREMETDPFLQEAMEGLEKVTPEEVEETKKIVAEFMNKKREKAEKRKAKAAEKADGAEAVAAGEIS